MSIARAPCPNCQLPFYTDRNENCPYCGSAPGTVEPTATGAAPVDTTPAGSVRRERPPSRPRTTCSQCGLDHYADDDSGCPYCNAAASHGTAEAASEESEPAPETEPEPATPTAGGEGGGDRTSRQSSDSGGLVSRLLGIFGR